MSVSLNQPVAKHRPRRSRPKHSVPTSLAYRIRTYGRIRNQPYHSTHGTHGQDIMLTVIRSGCGFYLRDTDRQQVSAGMVGLVLPKELPKQATQQSKLSGILVADQGILMADPDDPYDHDYCRFAGEQACEVAQRIAGLHRSQAFFVTQHWVAILDLMQQIRRLYPSSVDFSQEPDNRPPTPAEGLLASLLALLEMPAKTPTDEQGVTSTSLRRYLHDHLAQPLSLDHMAEYFGISKEHLCRLAKASLGFTIVTVSEQIKIDWACVLLGQKEVSIAQVARRVGYVDPLYFSKVFRKQMDRSPRQWRATYENR